MRVLLYYIGLKYSKLYIVQFAQKNTIKKVNVCAHFFIYYDIISITIKYDYLIGLPIKHRVFTDFYTVYSIKVKFVS